MLLKTANPELRLLKIKPNWRFEVLLNPAGNKFKEYLSTPTNGASCLKRLIGLGLPYEVHYKEPDEVKNYVKQLPRDQASKLQSLWHRSFKKSKQKKLLVDANELLLKRNPSWNMQKVNRIQDKFLAKAVKHVSNFEHNYAIAFALELYNSQTHVETVRYIGYCIYAKIEDKNIAKRWNVPTKVITALRMLFFDFSNFPKDRLANFTCLRQLANSGVISDTDFAYYKRVYELGELGLKAQTDFFSLDDKEKRKVEEYLGKSIVANTLNINFSIRNLKDANNYGAAVSNLASYYIKQAEISYFSAKTKNTEASTRKLEGDMVGVESNITDLDQEILNILREHSLHETTVEYKTLDSLK
jgi:hypothetical protein